MPTSRTFIDAFIDERHPCPSASISTFRADLLAAMQVPVLSAGTSWLAGRTVRRRSFTAAVCATALLAAWPQPALAEAPVVQRGDIVVADTEPFFAPGGVFAIDPVTGAQAWVANGGRHHFRMGLAFEGDGDILVSNGFAYGGGYSVSRIDAATGVETTVAEGIASSGMAVEADGDILVAATGVVRVDPVTGAQTTISSGGALVRPAGLAIEADGDILVADAGAFDEAGAIVRVNPVTGAQTTVSSGGSFVDPTGVAVEPDGDIVVSDPEAFGGTGGVIRVDAVTGAQATLSSGGFFVDPRAIALEQDGDIVVADSSAFPFSPPDAYPEKGGVIRVDPVSGAQSEVSSGGRFGNPVAIAVAPQTLNTPPDCSGVVANPSALPPDARKFETITLSGAGDADHDTLSWRIDSVQQDEPVSRAGGKQSGSDAQLPGGAAATNQVQVRAERIASGNGRVYRIAYTVSDGTAGCSGVAHVSVARNKHEGAVDDGDTQRWDSFTGEQVVP